MLLSVIHLLSPNPKGFISCGLRHTLLWTSQGLAMADRSQAVIIIALETQEWHLGWHAIWPPTSDCQFFSVYWTIKISTAKQFTPNLSPNRSAPRRFTRTCFSYHKQAKLTVSATLCKARKVEKIKNEDVKFECLTKLRNEWMVQSVIQCIHLQDLELPTCFLRVCFAPTWQFLCVWSPASCTWSSRSSFRRSWTGPRSSGTWPSSCPQAERKRFTRAWGVRRRAAFDWLLGWLEVESQVCGDDSDVHQVNDDVVLAAVQILVNVQCLNMQGGKKKSQI